MKTVLRNIAYYLDAFLCFIGSHHWDEPGGHCTRCFVCDEFLGPHIECRRTLWQQEEEDDTYQV